MRPLTLGIVILLLTQLTAAERPILHWTFDAPYEFGAFEYDCSGHNNDGVVVWDRIGGRGGMQWAPDKGVLGGAANMPNGVRGHMKSDGDISLPAEWSISFWVNPIVTKGRIESLLSLSDQSKRILNIGGHNKGGYTVSHHDGAQNQNYSFVYPMMKKGHWNHVMIVWSQNEVTCYHNGVAKKLPLKTPWDPSRKLNVAFSGGSHQHRSYGLFDELRIYPHALSPKELMQLSDADFYKSEKRAPVADGGMGYTTFLEKGGLFSDDHATFKMIGRELRPGQNAGTSIYQWTVLSQPNGAKSSFSNPLAPQTTFTTNKAGDYRFKLTVSNEAGSDDAMINGVVFNRDKGSASAKFHTYSVDSIAGEMIAPHPERAAQLKGKPIEPISYWNFDDGSANGMGSRPTTLNLPEAATFEAQGKVGGGLAIRPTKKNSGIIDFGAFSELSDEFTVAFWATSERKNLKAEFFRAMGENKENYWFMMNSHNSSKVPLHSLLGFQGLVIPIHIEGHWRHIVISYSKTENFCKLWVNGWLVGSKLGAPLNQKASGIPRLIFNKPGVNYSFEGIIDEVAIFDKMLNNEEVYQIYEKGVPALTERVAEDPYSTRAYRQSFVDKWFPEPTPSYQSEHFAEDRFDGGDLPAYTHPRLNMTMEDLPRIRQSFLKSRHGSHNRAFMYLYSRTQFGYQFQNYSPNTKWKDDAKNPLSDPRKNVVLNSDEGATGRMSLALEALLKADRKLARILIENMVKAAEVQQAVIDQGLKKGFKGWQHWYHDILGRRCTQVMYDYLYNWMTEAEKNKIRKVIATATSGNWSVGMYAMPALYANRSNWQAWITGDMLMALQSIYGEDGFSQFTYDEAAKAVYRCAEIMNDPESGAHYEGMGKSNINSTQMSVLSMMQPKGQKIISSKALYNNVAKFHLHIGLPWDSTTVMYDQKNGGNARMAKSPINVLHYAYPEDPIINYLKHCIEENVYSYTGMRPKTFGQESWIISAAYTQEWKGPADLREHLNYAVEKSGEPLGYFSDFRGQMISRSSWEPDALQLNYVPRVIKGGHHAPIKGYFIVNGLQRQWIEFRSRANHHTRTNSCITVDGQGQDGSMARSLSYTGASKTKGATFDILSSDLTGAYRQIDNRWPNLNYTRLKPDPRPWFNMPKQHLTHWYLGDRPHSSVYQEDEEFDPVNYKGKQEFSYAYRTAAFARGKHPYILIVDDFKKDDKVREYIWHGALPEDLKANKSAHKINGDTAILTDPKDPTKHLFVKMFGYEGEGAFAIEHILPTQDVDRAKMNLATEQMPHNLKFKNKTDTAKFRVLLYAFRNGDPLPKVSGTDDNYTISIGEQKDLLKIDKPSGKGSRLSFERQQ